MLIFGRNFVAKTCDGGLIFHLFLFIILFFYFVGTGMIDWLVGWFVHRIDFLLVSSNYVFLNCSVFYESICTLLFHVKTPLCIYACTYYFV